MNVRKILPCMDVYRVSRGWEIRKCLMEIFHNLWNLPGDPHKRTMPSLPKKAPITLLAYCLRHIGHRPSLLVPASSLCGLSSRPTGMRIAYPLHSGWPITVWLPLWSWCCIISWSREMHLRTRTCGFESGQLLSVSLAVSTLLCKMGCWY